MPMTVPNIRGATTALDISANTNHGTASGNPVIGATSTAFDGTDAFTIPSSFNSTFKGDFSICIWLKPDDGQPAVNNGIYGDPGNGSTVWQYLVLVPSGKIVYFLRANSDQEQILTDSAVFPDGATSWTHILVTGNQATAEFKMYVNSVLEPTTITGSITSGNWAAYNSPSSTYFLGDYNDAGGSFVGNHAHTRIWNRVLSTTEITQEYNRNRNTYQP